MTTFNWGPILHNLPALWAGMQLTLVLTLLAILGGFVLGTLLAIAQLSPIKLIARAATLYVDFFRSIPLILAVFWFYFLVPLLLGHPVGPFFSVPVDSCSSKVPILRRSCARASRVFAVGRLPRLMRLD